MLYLMRDCASDITVTNVEHTDFVDACVSRCYAVLYIVYSGLVVLDHWSRLDYCK